MRWIFNLNTPLDKLLVSFRLSKIYWLKIDDEGRVSFDLLFEIGPRKAVQRSLNFAFEKPSGFLVNPELASQLTRANTFACSGDQVSKGKGTLDQELQFVEDCVRCWLLVVKAFLATKVCGLFALDRGFLTARTA